MRQIFLLVQMLLVSINVIGQDITPDLSGLKPEVKDNGYNAKEVNYFDNKGNVVFTITYDTGGKYEDTPFGVAIIERKYDRNRNLIERRFYTSCGLVLCMGKKLKIMR